MFGRPWKVGRWRLIPGRTTTGRLRLVAAIPTALTGEDISRSPSEWGWEAGLRAAVVARACEQYGYDLAQVEMRLYVGKFGSGHEDEVRRHLSGIANPPVRVIDLREIVEALVTVAGRRTYTDDPVVMTVKALAAAGRLHEGPEDVPL